MAAEEVTEQFIENMGTLNGIMEDLADTINKMASQTKAGTKARNNEIKSLSKSSDSFDALNDAVRNSTAEQEAYNKIIDASQAVWDKMVSGVHTVAQVLADSANQMLGGEGFGMFKSMVDPITKTMEAFGKMLGSGVNALMKLPGMIPVVGDAFEGLGKAAQGAIEGLSAIAAGITNFALKLALDATEQLWNMFEGAASAGLLVTNGLHEMQEQAMALNLTTAEYTKLIQSQAGNLTEFGGSVAEGAKKLKEVALASGEHNMRLRQLGISYEEQAEQTADFMANLQRTGQLRQMSDQQIADTSFEYMKNLRVISALTGKTADQMKEDRDAALQNLAFQAELAKMDPAVRTEMESALSAMPEGMQQAFKESIIFGEVLTDTGAIVSGTAPIIEQFANSVRDGSATSAEALQTFRDTLKDQAPQLRENLSSLAAAGMAELLGKGNAVTGSINEFSASLLKQIAIAEGALEEQVEATGNVDVGESVESLVSMMDTQRVAMHRILKLTQENLDPMASVMAKTVETIDKVFEETASFVNDPEGWVNKMTESIDVMGKLDNMTGGAVTQLSNFNSWLKQTTDMDLTDLLLRANPITGPAMLAKDAAGAISDKASGAWDTVTGWFGDDDDEANTAVSARKGTSELDTVKQERQELRDRLNELMKEQGRADPRTEAEIEASGGMTRNEEIKMLRSALETMTEELVRLRKETAVGNREAERRDN